MRRAPGNVAATLDAAARVAAREPYADALGGLPDGWLFAGPDETVARLEAAGFEDAARRLIEAPATLDDGERPTSSRRWSCATTSSCWRPSCARRTRRRWPGLLRGPDGRVVLDYVRLNMEARRPAP